MKNILKKNIFQEKKDLIITIGLSTIIFFILYNSFIFGDYKLITMFDPSSSYYPRFLYFINNITSIDLYDLKIGLGGEIFTILAHILNPFVLIFLFFNKNSMYDGLVWYVFIQFIVLTFFSYKYFDLLFKKSYSKIVTSLIWTYSGFTILWGQHYHFLTNIVYFTIVIYFWQRVLRGEKKYCFFVIIPLVLCVFRGLNNYYCVGICLALYTLFYTAFNAEKKLVILLNLLKLLGVGMYSLLIGMVVALPWLDMIFESNRAIGSFLSLLKPVNIQYGIYYISRIFSHELMVINGDYLGPKNRYELAILSSSVLSFISVFSLLSLKKYQKKTIIITALIIATLFIPFFNKVFLILNSQRWTWLIIFCFVLAIGLFLEEYKNIKKRHINLSLFLTCIILSLMVSYEVLYSIGCVNTPIIRTNVTVAFIIMFILFIYAILFNILFNKNNETRKIFRILIILTVSVEIILLNFMTTSPYFFKRYNKKFESSWYNDDNLKRSIEYIKDEDASLYRVATEYTNTHMVNNSLALNYNGISNYTSTTAKQTHKFVDLIGDNKISKVYNIYYTGIDNIANNLIAVKYYVLDKEVNNFDKTLIANFDYKYIYKNNNYLPFGYVYFTQYENLKDIEIEDRNILITDGFYLTESKELLDYEILYPEWLTNKKNKVSHLTDRIMKSTQIELNFKKNGEISINAIGNDPQLIIDLKEIKYEKGQVVIELNSPKNGYRLKAFYGDAPYSENNAKSFDLIKGKNKIEIPVIEQMDRIRIDPINNKGKITINEIYFEETSATDKLITENIKKLREVSIKDVRFENSTFTGYINNFTNKKGMMCIPIIYSDKWKATLNGETVDTHNINGGLIGIELLPGEYNVKLEYISMPLNIGIVISIVSLCIYLIFGMYLWRKKYLIKKNTNIKH